MIITAVFERCEGGGFHGFIKEIPGVHTQGETIQETTDNLGDALAQFIAYRVEQVLEHKDVSQIDHLEAELVS